MNVQEVMAMVVMTRVETKCEIGDWEDGGAC